VVGKKLKSSKAIREENQEIGEKSGHGTIENI